MQYGQIILLLFIALLLYYAAMIVLDIQRAKAMQAAEKDGQNEEDIDISDEAQSFQPVKVSRDEPAKQQEEERLPEIEQPLDSEEPFRRPGYREAVMTDGILVDDIIREIDRLAETGTSDLGTVIFTCENAR